MFPSTLKIPARVIVATLLAEHGETEILTYFNAFRRYLDRNGIEVDGVTPFRAPALRVCVQRARRKLGALLDG